MTTSVTPGKGAAGPEGETSGRGGEEFGRALRDADGRALRDGDGPPAVPLAPARN